MASRQLTRILAVLRAVPRPESPTVEQLRRAIEGMSAMVVLPPDVAREAAPVAGVPAERLAVAGADPARLVVFLHGGGYILGSASTHRELAARVGRAAGAVVLLPEYRLAPEHPFPAALEDVVAVYRAVLAQGFAPGRVAFVGDSAGGGLAVAALLALRDAGTPLPAAVACLSPWVDLAMTGASLEGCEARDPMVQRRGLELMARSYLQGGDPRHPLVSPIHADLAGLPPMLVQAGTAEGLFDDAVRLAERARVGGVDVTFEPWDEMIHVWHSFNSLPEARAALDRVGSFVRARLGAA